MNKILHKFSSGIEFIFGTIAFGALFASSFATTEKILIGSIIILFSNIIAVSLIQQDIFFRFTAKLNEVSFMHISQMSEIESEPLEKKLDAFFAKERIEDIASGAGISYVVIFLGKYTLWIVGGWLLSKYCFQTLL